MFDKKFYVMKQVINKEGTKKPLFTLRWVTFDTKRAVSGDEAKDKIRRIIKKSKATLDNEYDVIYAKASKAGRGGNVRTDYSLCVKPLANTVFVIPKSHRKEARKAISELSLKGNYSL